MWRTQRRTFQKCIVEKELLRRTCTNHLSRCQQHKMIRHAQYILHTMRNEDDGHAPFTMQHSEQGQQRFSAAGIKPRRRLVQDEIPGRERQHTRDGGTPLFPARECKWRTRSVTFVKSHEPHRILNARINLFLCESLIFRSKPDVFVHRLFKELMLRILEHHADAQTRC